MHVEEAIALSRVEELLAAASRDAASRPAFYEALLDADIYVIGVSRSDTVENDPMTVEEGSHLELQNWHDAEGATYLPFFTSLSVLSEALDSETPYITMTARDLFELTRGTRLILNPTHAPAKEFLPSEIDRLLSTGSAEFVEHRSAAPGSQIQLGQPANYPHEMIHALSALFKKLPEINRAYLAQMHDETLDPAFILLIGLEASGDLQELIPHIAAVISETAPKNQPVDLTPVSAGEDGVSAYFRKEVVPFYERKKPGILGSLFGFGNA